MDSSKTNSGWIIPLLGDNPTREGHNPFRVVSPGHGRGLKHPEKLRSKKLVPQHINNAMFVRDQKKSAAGQKP
jgi:hypothetical protein